jgi:o-succinylbenzoate synthase
MVRIVRAEVIRIPLHMSQPFEISSRRFQQKDALLARLYTDDGIVGYGESGALPYPFYVAEYIDSAQAVLTQFILPALIGQQIQNVEELAQIYGWIKGHYFAKVAVEGAYWHIISQQQRVPLYQVWGGTLTRVEVGTRFGIEPNIPTLLDKIEAALATGFRRIKIKIKPGFDIEPIAAIRHTFGDIELTVDANSSYTLAPAHVALLKELDQYNLMMIEQPLAHDDIIDHAQLQRQLRSPICLDESIQTYEDARKAIEIGACKIINIKPPRVGGFDIARRIAQLAHDHGLGVWCGGMFETGIGKGFNAHLCALETFNLPADNPGSRSYYANDLLIQDDPILVDKDAHITLPDGLGLGWKIDEEFINQHGIITAFAEQSTFGQEIGCI